MARGSVCQRRTQHTEKLEEEANNKLNESVNATRDELTESLDDYLAESKWYLDAFLERDEGGIEFIGLQKWTLRGNWKWGAEQHCSDFYHAQVSHVSYKDAFFPGASINRLKDVGEPEYGL